MPAPRSARYVAAARRRVICWDVHSGDVVQFYDARLEWGKTLSLLNATLQYCMINCKYSLLFRKILSERLVRKIAKTEIWQLINSRW